MQPFQRPPEFPSRISKPAYPSLPQAFGLLGYLLLFSVIIAIPLVIVLGDQKSGNFDISETLIYCGSALLVIFHGNRQRRSTRFSFGNIPIGLYFLILLMVPAWIVVIEPVINLIPMNDWARKMFEGFRPDGFLKIAMIVAAAPMLEELLFRGIILEGFLKRYSPWKAILLSSFLFGLIHLNPWQFVVAFGLGNMLGWLYWKTGSLLPCIFLHYVNNTLATISNFMTPEVSADQSWITDPMLYAVIFSLSLLILGITIFFCARILKTSEVNLPVSMRPRPV